MMISQALQYPFRGKGSFRRILILTLVQFVPIVGQLILLGYGFDVVRAVYGGQIALPPVRWLPALGNGCRFLLTGLFYLLPILITVGIVGASSMGFSGNLSKIGPVGILLSVGLPILLFLVQLVAVRKKKPSSVQQTQARGSTLRSLLSGLLSICMTVLAIFVLKALVSSSGIETGKPNGLSLLLFLLLALALFVIGIALYVGGTRYALENKGLFAPMTNAKLLLANRTLTGALLLNVFLLYVIAAIEISVGLVLLILPGLFALVICSLALWYLFAIYIIQVGIRKPTFTFVKNTFA